VIRRTSSSCRWPFLTRLRAFGRYLTRSSSRPIASNDLSLDGSVRHDRGANGGLVAVGDQQHAVERDVVAGLGLEELDLELGADLDAILLSAGPR